MKIYGDGALHHPHAIPAQDVLDDFSMMKLASLARRPCASSAELHSTNPHCPLLERLWDASTTSALPPSRSSSLPSSSLPLPPPSHGDVQFRLWCLTIPHSVTGPRLRLGARVKKPHHLRSVFQTPSKDVTSARALQESVDSWHSSSSTLPVLPGASGSCSGGGA